MAGQNREQRRVNELNQEIDRQRQEIDDAIRGATPNFDIDDIPEEVQGHVIFDSLSGRGQLHVATGFTEDEINRLYQMTQPFCVTVRQPGPRPRSSWLDMIVCYLAWAKLGCDYPKLALLLGGISATRLEDNIKQIRPVLKDTLIQKWFDSPQRPRPLTDTPFPHVALLVDAHTMPCYRPKAQFDEAKIYFDGKNQIYGLKTEVAVSAQAPYYCTHVSSSVPGSVHDFELFKKGYERYLTFLMKLPAEHAALVGDQDDCYWALLCDKGYIGPDDASPDVRRICPVKNPQNHNDRMMNNLKAQKRVMIECFFGRLLGLFNIFRTCY